MRIDARRHAFVVVSFAVGCSAGPSPAPTPAPPPTVIEVATPAEERDARALCLAPQSDHRDASPCDTPDEVAACRFHQGTEFFQRRDFPAAAELFVPLALEEQGQLGRAAGENALVAVATMMKDTDRAGCRDLYQTLAPQVIARHCPWPASAEEQDCTAMHRLVFTVDKGLLLQDFSLGKIDREHAAETSEALFEQHCTATGPMNSAAQAPVAAGCDELLSNAYRLRVQLGDTAHAQTLRAKFLDPANRLADSPYATDFTP